MWDRGTETFDQGRPDVMIDVTIDLDDDLDEGEDPAAAVALLHELAGPGPALDLAIGTGRIAVPLGRLGLRVDGFEISLDRVAALHARPGAETLTVALGGPAEASTPQRYPLVFLVGDELASLATQEEQVRCFDNAARHLTADGLFLVETVVPTYLRRARNDRYVDSESLAAGTADPGETDDAWYDVTRHDPVTQVLTENQVRFTPAGIRMSSTRTRYTWPSELDLMARLAGLRRVDRWGGWRREPFTADCRTHICVYSPA